MVVNPDGNNRTSPKIPNSKTTMATRISTSEVPRRARDRNGFILSPRFTTSVPVYQEAVVIRHRAVPQGDGVHLVRRDRLHVAVEEEDQVERAGLRCALLVDVRVIGAPGHHGVIRRIL